MNRIRTARKKSKYDVPRPTDVSETFTINGKTFSREQAEALFTDDAYLPWWDEFAERILAAPPIDVDKGESLSTELPLEPPPFPAKNETVM